MSGARGGGGGVPGFDPTGVKYMDSASSSSSSDSDSSDEDGHGNFKRMKREIKIPLDRPVSPLQPGWVGSGGMGMRMDLDFAAGAGTPMESEVNRSKSSSSSLTPDTKPGTTFSQTQFQPQPQGYVPDGTNNEYFEMAKRYQSKKAKHVWTQIAEDEKVQETAEEFEMAVNMVDKFRIQRGSESYTVGDKRKRVFVDPSSEIKHEKKIESDYESDSSISNFGLSDDETAVLNEQAKVRKLANKSRLERKKLEIESRPKSRPTRTSLSGQESTDKLEEETLNIDGQSTSAQNQGNATADLKPKPKTGAQTLEGTMALIEDYKIPFYVQKKLHEPKKELMVRAFKLLGRETCLNLFRKTLKIERNGGLTIKNGSRRRTPGGVFFYLLRRDSRIPTEAKNEVFKKVYEEKIKKEKDPNRLKKIRFEGLKERLAASATKAAMTIMDFHASEKAQDGNSDMEEGEIQEDTYALPKVEAPQAQAGYVDPRMGELVDYSDLF